MDNLVTPKIEDVYQFDWKLVQNDNSVLTPQWSESLTRSIFISHLGENDELNKTLMDTIDECGDKQRQTTNVYSDMTYWYMSFEPGFDQIAKYAEDMSKLVYKDLKHAITWDIWGARYYANDWAQNHYHLPAFCSFVYYPKVEPDHPGLYFPDLMNENGNVGCEIMPATGDFMMWRSDIRHGVQKQRFADARYVVAGNVYYKYYDMTDKQKMQHHKEANENTDRQVLNESQ